MEFERENMLEVQESEMQLVDNQMDLDTAIVDHRTRVESLGIPFTPEQCEALAVRVDAVLRERKRVGEERRRYARELQLRNIERARLRYERAKQLLQEPTA